MLRLQSNRAGRDDVVDDHFIVLDHDPVDHQPQDLLLRLEGWLLSMSRKLWVRFFYCFENVHREVALQRPLLAAPQHYLRR